MNKTETRVIRNVIARLRGADQSPRVTEALESIRDYLETWVVPPLELLVTPKRDVSDLALASDLSGGQFGTSLSEAQRAHTNALVDAWVRDARAGRQGTFDVGEIDAHAERMRDDPGAFAGILCAYGTLNL